jgi:hypothetical protein
MARRKTRITPETQGTAAHPPYLLHLKTTYHPTLPHQEVDFRVLWEQPRGII